MNQEINNNGNVDTQVNAARDAYFTKPSRFSKRFEKLKNEFQNDIKHQEVLDELKYYITKLDGIGLTQKLKDGGFSDLEILKASSRKELYWKKHEKFRFYESAQKTDIELFAKIIIDFETYIEPLITNEEKKDVIMKSVVKNLINPILAILNEEGADDELLNYNAEEVFGMIYHLTGTCHLYWKNYDNI